MHYLSFQPFVFDSLSMNQKSDLHWKYYNIENIVLHIFCFIIGVACHTIKSLANGVARKFGPHYLFSCNAGYNLNGNTFVACSGGKLATAVPSCVGRYIPSIQNS